MTKRRFVVLAVAVILFTTVILVLLRRASFNWNDFLLQLSFVRFGRIGLAIGLIYLSVSLRSVRWAVLLRPTRVNPFFLVAPQFIGFASVALLGSLADLIRPYLIAKRVHRPLSSQMATYTLERMFDIGSAAALFAGAFVLSLTRFGSTQGHALFRAGLASLVAAVGLTLFAAGVYLYGEGWADHLEDLPYPRFRAGLATLATRVREFREGLTLLRSLGDLLRVLVISLGIWSLVAVACMQVVHSFASTPSLRSINFVGVMLILAASIGGSLVQLPVVGWFTQIAVTAGTMHAVFGAPPEAATACGVLLLLVTFLCLIPAGLVFAQMEHVPLRDSVLEAQLEKEESLKAALH